jgi:hypothetical protein
MTEITTLHNVSNFLSLSADFRTLVTWQSLDMFDFRTVVTWQSLNVFDFRTLVTWQSLNVFDFRTLVTWQSLDVLGLSYACYMTVIGCVRLSYACYMTVIGCVRLWNWNIGADEQKSFLGLEAVWMVICYRRFGGAFCLNLHCVPKRW